MNDARLIALYSPRPQSGKSTVAGLLGERGFLPVKFATTLKVMTGAFLRCAGISAKDLSAYVEGELKEKQIPGMPKGITSRLLQRKLGVEWGRRQIYDNVWVDLAIAQARAQMQAGKSVVIDDMRFPNEYKAVLKAGGEVWRIVRQDRQYVSDGHSEALLEGEHFDAIIKNTGSMKDLRAKVSAILQLPCPPGELINNAR